MFALVGDTLIRAMLCSSHSVLGSHAVSASLHGASTNQLALGFPTLRVCSIRGLSVPCSNSVCFTGSSDGALKMWPM